MQAFAAPDSPDGDTTTGGDEESIDDYLAPPYDSYDSSYDEDLAWYDTDGETWEDDYELGGADWCEEADEPVCGYVE